MITVDKHFGLAATRSQLYGRHDELVEHAALCSGFSSRRRCRGFPRLHLHLLLLLLAGVAVQQLRFARLRKLFDPRCGGLSDMVERIVGIVCATCGQRKGREREGARMSKSVS